MPNRSKQITGRQRERIDLRVTHTHTRALHIIESIKYLIFICMCGAMSTTALKLGD